MKRRMAQWFQIIGMLALAIGTISLVRWHPDWLIWTMAAIWALNILLIIGLAVGWTILARRAQKTASEESDNDAAD